MRDELPWAEALRRAVRLASSLGAGEAADDVAQLALMRAWRARDSLRDSDAFIGWVLQITRNEMMRWATARREDATIDESVADDPQASEFDLIEVRSDIARAMAELSESDRQLIELRYFADLTQPAGFPREL